MNNDIHIYTFEKLEIWQKSISLSKAIYSLSINSSDETPVLFSQMQNTVVSVSANIAKSYENSKIGDTLFSIKASGELMKLLTHIYICKELEYINDHKFVELKNLVSEVVDFLNSSSTEISSSLYFAHETAVVDDNCEIGEGTKIWHFSHIMSGSIMGMNCNIGQNVVVSPGVELGNNVKIQNNVSIYTGVICEDDVFLGPSMVFTNVINPRSAVNRKNEYLKTIVKKGVSIGANATIVCGNDIGKYAFIGAGAVVTKSVPDYALLVGNPARQIGWISEFGHRLTFNKDGVAICKESNEKYRLEDNAIMKFK